MVIFCHFKKYKWDMCDFGPETHPHWSLAGLSGARMGQNCSVPLLLDLTCLGRSSLFHLEAVINEWLRQ